MTLAETTTNKIYLNKGYKNMKEVLEANDIDTLMEWIKAGEDFWKIYHETQSKMKMSGVEHYVAHLGLGGDDFFADL